MRKKPQRRDNPPTDPEILLPPNPNEVCGWGRLKRIILKFPTAQLEALGALGFFGVGLWFLAFGHKYPTAGVLTASYGRWVGVWGIVFTLLGVYKTWVILWAYQTRHRIVVSALALIAIWQMCLAYIVVWPSHVAVMVTSLAMIHQFWIVARNRRSWYRD